jgi:hypothetical protein
MPEELAATPRRLYRSRDLQLLDHHCTPPPRDSRA